jgi:AAA+ superfamily predicted ATPase
MVNIDDQKINANVFHLDQEFKWLESIVHTRIETYLGKKASYSDIFEVPVPSLNSQPSVYSNFIEYYKMTIPERLTLLLALAPHVRPQLLDIFLIANTNSNRIFTEFGGVKGQMHGGFLPTGETLLFILSGTDLNARFYYQRLFDRDHFFRKHNILKLEEAPFFEPPWSGQLVLSKEIVDLLTSGSVKKPQFSRNFPARLITSKLTWDDLVLNAQTENELQELLVWVKYNHLLMNDLGMYRKLSPGYRCLFHGPPGTGKTLTTTLIGKLIDKDVYRIDLSTIVSKYIGETEKNLEKVFEQAENFDCILFFDEADALYGKRTNISDAHDRYANQEVAYLLQRLEDYSGLVILATNYKSNIDEAFIRRFQSLVHFPVPDENDRFKLWKGALPENITLDDDIDLKTIAEKYKLSGGSIMNIIRYVLLLMLEHQSNVIRYDDILNGIRREFQKEGKTI